MSNMSPRPSDVPLGRNQAIPIYWYRHDRYRPFDKRSDDALGGGASSLRVDACQHGIKL